MKKDLNHLKRISKEVITIGIPPLLTVKHMIILKRGVKINGVFQENPFYFEYQLPEDKISNFYNVLMGRVTEYLTLESKTYKDITSQYQSFIKHQLYYKDFIDLKRSLLEVTSWFKEDLYTYSTMGNIIELKEEKKKLISTCFSKFTSNNSYLTFQPTIVFDNAYSYPGVSIKTNRGTLCEMSFDEFLLLKMTLEEYIKNFHQLSQQLIQIAYLHSIENKDMKDENNDNKQ